MKLIKASTEIITPINGEDILIQIEKAARTCYKSEDKIEIENLPWGLDPENPIKYKAISARKLIPNLIQRGHEAMIEFGGMIHVLFICDRGVSHEFVRHRMASFAQESTRYCNCGKDEHIQFIIPSWFTQKEIDHSCEILKNKQWDETPFGIWSRIMQYAEDNYNFLIKDYKYSPQQARSILPNSLKTEINISCNIREWRHIFKLRTANVAHPDMQYLMRPLLAEFQSKIPILFDDIKY